MPSRPFVPKFIRQLLDAIATAGAVYTFPTTTATIARTDAAQTFTGHQTIEGVTSTGATGTGKFVFDTSPTIVTPVISTITTATLKPAADSTTAVQIAKANGTTIVVNVDTTNGRVGIGTASPVYALSVNGDIDVGATGSASLRFTGGSYYIAESWGLRFAGGDGTHPLYIPASTSSFLVGYSGDSTNYGSSNLFVAGKVSIGKIATTYLLELNTDSAGKPGAGGLWTVVSDERIKKDIVPANLDRCYEIVKSVPLKHFAFADGVYKDEQINDKHNLGWIAQDVQKVFKNAVSEKLFAKYPGNKGYLTCCPHAISYKEEIIEDCLDLNSGQLIAALYGAVQQLMNKVEKLEGKLK